MSERITTRIARAGGIGLLAGTSALTLVGCGTDGTFTRYALVDCPGLGAVGAIPTFPEYVGLQDGDLTFNCRPPKGSIEVLQDADRKPNAITVTSDKPVLETDSGLFEIQVRLNSELLSNPDPTADVVVYDTNERELLQLRTDTAEVMVTPLFYLGDTPKIR